MPSENRSPRLYASLASWFHLLTAPEDYAEEAAFAHQTLVSTSKDPIQSVLELGSGGGNNAFHLKRSFQMTLVDLSPEMITLSETINADCSHVVGDMRSVRLERQFDGVFVHDAIMYMTTPDELKDVVKTAWVHCKAGGVALIMPDFVKETFVSGVHHGGHDGDSRGLRYIQWTFDPIESDSTYTVDFAYLLREGKSPVHVEHDCHVFGLFSRALWLEILTEVGFEAEVLTDPYGREVFACRKRLL
jgi:SAM-dependent methyltransferase